MVLNAMLMRDRSWDEKRVGEWLQSINCGQYEKLFKGQFEIAMLRADSYGFTFKIMASFAPLFPFGSITNIRRSQQRHRQQSHRM